MLTADQHRQHGQKFPAIGRENSGLGYPWCFCRLCTTEQVWLSCFSLSVRCMGNSISWIFLYQWDFFL